MGRFSNLSFTTTELEFRDHQFIATCSMVDGQGLVWEPFITGL